MRSSQSCLDSNMKLVEPWSNEKPLGQVPTFSGLGFDFALLRLARCDAVAARLRLYDGPNSWPGGIPRARGRMDLAAVSHLDEVRTADLTQSRAILEMASPNHGLRHMSRASNPNTRSKTIPITPGTVNFVRLLPTTWSSDASSF